MEGTDDIYDLTPAPGTVTEEGTFLNVESLLKDTTAALLGGDANMVPDEALVALKNALDSLGVTVDSLPRIESGSYKGTGASENVTLTFSEQPKVVFISTSINSAVTQCLVYGSTKYVFASASAAYDQSLAWEANTLKIYNRYGSAFNVSEFTHNYFAIF